MLGTINGILRFLGLTDTQRTARTKAIDGEVLYNGEHDQFQGRRGGAFLNFLMEGDAAAPTNASPTVKGVVEVATDTQFNDGTDTGETGASLVPTMSQLRDEFDTKVEVAGDISGTFDEPLVAQSTSDTGLLLRDVANTLLVRIKAAASSFLQIRNSADSAFGSLEAEDITAHGDVLIEGNLTVQGTTTTVDSDNMTVKDNVIELNKGEAGAGVTLGFSGLSIDRGTEDAAEIGYNETNDRFEAGLTGARKIIGYKVEGTLGASSDTHVITHNLNTTRIAAVGVWDGDEAVSCEAEATSADTITLYFGTPVSGYDYAIIG